MHERHNGLGSKVALLEKAGLKYVKNTLYHDIPVKKYLMKQEDFQQTAVGAGERRSAP